MHACMALLLLPEEVVDIFRWRFFPSHQMIERFFSPEKMIHVPRRRPLAPAHEVVEGRLLSSHQVVGEGGGRRLFSPEKVVHLGATTTESEKVTPEKE